jgi:eukaryotic-like serine/threonine-protein kinase
MADEIAVDSFLDLLRQSDLIADDQLLALTSEFGNGKSTSESSRTLAGELVKRKVLTSWQAEMLLQGKHRGFRLGPYRILRPLGQGGMSKVFLGEHEMMHRCCAIKVLPSKYQEDPDLLNRFHLEARAIAALDHPNIVRAYDFNKDVRYGSKEIHYLVMEYVEGPDLRRMVEEQGPLDYRKAADFICQAAEGLAHAHAAGFVHRDIKPANLLVDPHGVLKVLDLGLATFTLEAEEKLGPEEGTQSAVGTADYVAPEQVADSRNVDGRADIYSLGLTFYYLLTGRRPFSKPTVMELLMAHQKEKPEPIGKFRPDVPMDLESIIDKMIAKSPMLRYQTAKDVAEKLRKWLSESGSARSYSRLSALMAEAARTKPPSAQDTARVSKVSSTENTELELALAEDVPAAPPPETPPPRKTVAPAEVIPLDMRDKSRRPGVKDSSSSKIGGSSPKMGSSSSKLNKPASKSVGVLPGLTDEDIMSALPPAPPAQMPLQFAPAKSQEEQGFGELMKSPWVWVGLAGLLGVIVLVIAMIRGSSPKPQPYSPPSVTETQTTPTDTQPIDTRPATQPPAPVVPPKPLATQQEEPPKPAPTAPEATKPAKKPKKSSAPKQEPPVKPVETPSVEAPSAVVPVVPEKDVKKVEPTQEKTSKPSKDKDKEKEKKDKEADKKKPKGPTEEELRKLLAQLESFSIQVELPEVTDAKQKKNQETLERNIKTSVKEVVSQANLKIDDDAKSQMEIAMKVADGMMGIMMSIELKCPGPDEKTVTVWKKSENVPLQTPRIMNALKRNVIQFRKDYIKARNPDEPKAGNQPTPKAPSR